MDNLHYTSIRYNCRTANNSLDIKKSNKWGASVNYIYVFIYFIKGLPLLKSWKKYVLEGMEGWGNGCRICRLRKGGGGITDETTHCSVKLVIKSAC